MIDSKRRRSTLLIVAVLPLFTFFLAPPGYTQDSREVPYTIPVTVRRVVLDVVVTDSAHDSVHHLRREDFNIFEDNQEQQIRTFEEMDSDRTLSQITPHLPPLPPDTWVNAAAQPEGGPLYIIVLDELHLFRGNDKHIQLEDQVWARQELAKFLAGKPPGTRFALFLLAQDFRMVQGFTTDPSQLLHGFDAVDSTPHLPWVFLNAQNYGIHDPALPCEVLAFIGRYLNGLPGRKNLIWISRYFPVPIPMFGLPNTQGGAKDIGGGYHPAPGTMGNSFEEKVMREAIDALDEAQVSVYPVDVSVGCDFAAHQIADATGGQAYEGNDLQGSLKAATEHGRSYYEITYAPHNPDYDGKMRNIRVELSCRSCTPEYRRKYFADSPYAPLTNEEKATAAAVANQVVAHHPGDSLSAYMQHGAPAAREMLFRAHFTAGPAAMATPGQMTSLAQQPAYFAQHRNRNSAGVLPPVLLRTVTIDYLVLNPATDTSAGQQIMEFSVAAYDEMGKMLNGLSQDAARPQPSQKGDPAAQQYFRALQTLDVPETATWIRVAVRDTRTDRIGTIEIPLPLASEHHNMATPANSTGLEPPR
jgi:VWFA-related protein